MLKIGDVAKRFSISNRTLRYWEEAGILNSSRMENGYRFYEGEDEIRIRQIVMLRKLKMPIVEIERIFMAADFNVAIDALTSHLENLRQDAADYTSLISLIEVLLQRLQGTKNLEQVFACLETDNIATDERHTYVPNIELSRRGSIMAAEQLQNVRIVQIPALTLAAYRAESSTPEDDCSKVFNKFVLENNLHKRSGYRYFGFNNPSPSDGNPVYGYEMWVSIPDDFTVPEPLEKKQFSGGLYASISTTMNEIGERWQILNDWCKSNEKYDIDFSLQWLEECCMDFETFISDHVIESEKQLDLLEPIKCK